LKAFRRKRGLSRPVPQIESPKEGYKKQYQTFGSNR
jgi:hypothetical protein